MQQNFSNKYHRVWDRIIIAWGVHLYTAVGGVIGVFALIFAAEGKFAKSFLFLLLQMAIDSTDGIFARRLQVKEKLPNFDGASMDNVIDILTYAWIPIFIIAALDILPSNWLLLIPIFASLYAYGQVNMKTEDSFFLGFPTYWNVVALYLYFLRPDEWIASLMILVPGILSFIPTRYLYPSKNSYFWKTTFLLCTIWFGIVVYLLLQDSHDKNLVYASLFFPIYYMGLSFFVDFKVRKKNRKTKRETAKAQLS